MDKGLCRTDIFLGEPHILYYLQYVHTFQNATYAAWNILSVSIRSIPHNLQRATKASFVPGKKKKKKKCPCGFSAPSPEGSLGHALNPVVLREGPLAGGQVAGCWGAENSGIWGL